MINDVAYFLNYGMCTCYCDCTDKRLNSESPIISEYSCENGSTIPSSTKEREGAIQPLIFPQLSTQIKAKQILVYHPASFFSVKPPC